ncbi:hypothetical protein KCU87_g350, partial [Aureobasidium melanogenum]
MEVASRDPISHLERWEGGDRKRSFRGFRRLCDRARMTESCVVSSWRYGAIFARRHAHIGERSKMTKREMACSSDETVLRLWPFDHFHTHRPSVTTTSTGKRVACSLAMVWTRHTFL